MRLRILFPLLLTFVSAGFSVCAQTPKSIKWLRSLTAGQAAAKPGGKLIMLDLFSERNGYCKRMDLDTYSDAKVVQAVVDVVPVRVDVDKDGKAVVEKYKDQVAGFPTILFVDSDGAFEGKIADYMGPAQFLPAMKRFVELHREIPALEAKYKSGDRGLEMVSKLAATYADRGNIERAKQYMEDAEKAAAGSVPADLARAYNAVGDFYQLKEDLATAIPYFTKAAKAADGAAQGYARLSLGACYQAQGKNEDAIRELKAVIDLPNATPKDKSDARFLLSQLEKKP